MSLSAARMIILYVYKMKNFEQNYDTHTYLNLNQSIHKKFVENLISAFNNY